MNVVIIGGGVMGAATASFLARRHAIAPLVLERDASYARASSALSACAIRQQFSTAINIRLSQESLYFLRRVGEELAVGDERPGIALEEPGYLYLATEAGAPVLRANRAVQDACGARVALLDPAQLAHRFPWLSTDGVALGALGERSATSGEGWFDGYRLLRAFRDHAQAHGARFREAEATGLVREGRRVTGVRTADGAVHPADAVVLAAGAWSARVAALAGFDLPVRARKRDVFVVQTQALLPHCPLVIDPSGFWFRPEGAAGRFLCGAPPAPGEDHDDAPLEQVDHARFTDWIWPRMAARVPAFDALRVTGAWAGYYEYNTVDQNGLVGWLPGTDNLVVATGFSGHGLQQAPAVGRGVAELLATGAYQSLDLSPLGVERLVEGRPLRERNII